MDGSYIDKQQHKEKWMEGTNNNEGKETGVIKGR